MLALQVSSTSYACITGSKLPNPPRDLMVNSECCICWFILGSQYLSCSCSLLGNGGECGAHFILWLWLLRALRHFLTRWYSNCVYFSVGKIAHQHNQWLSGMYLENFVKSSSNDINNMHLFHCRGTQQKTVELSACSFIWQMLTSLIFYLIPCFRTHNDFWSLIIAMSQLCLIILRYSW